VGLGKENEREREKWPERGNSQRWKRVRVDIYKDIFIISHALVSVHGLQNVVVVGRRSTNI
jgi:hypothetical protein